MATAKRSTEDIHSITLEMTDTEAGRLWWLLDKIANGPLDFTDKEKDRAAEIGRAIPRECLPTEAPRD